MNARLYHGGIAMGALTLVAGVALGGKTAAHQRRLAKFYNNVQIALNRAVAHYEGTLCALLVCKPSGDSLHNPLFNRPAVDIPNSAELTLDAHANVIPEELALLTITLTGKTDVVMYVIKRLKVDETLRVGIDIPHHDEGITTATVHIMVRDAEPAHAVEKLVSRTS